MVMANNQTNHTVNVQVQSTGLGKLKSQWADFAGTLLEPVAILASGGTKVQAIWAGVKAVFMAKVLGPLELGVGASIAFLAMTKRLVGAWKELGMASAATLERMTIQFRPLLGSMERARDRVKELMEFTAKTPFRLEETAEANKILENLTKGALSTKDGMYLVGDAAAVANAGFAETARSVGRLYDGLMAGRPVGEAAMRLQEMGVITGTTRNQIESLQATNASGLQIWKIVEAEMRRNVGAMNDMSVSLEGLQSTYEDTKMALQAGFSEKFMEGEKAGVESSIKMMEKLQPVANALGRDFGALSNWWEKLKAKAVESVTSFEGFGTTVLWLVRGVLGFASALAVAGGVAMAGFVTKILLMAAGNRAALQSQMALNAAQGSSVGVMTKMRAVKASLTAASQANAAGLRAEAAAHMQAAGAGLKNIVATNGVTTATKVAGLTMRGMGAAVRFVGVQFKALAVSMLTNPLFLAVAALMAVGMALKHFSDKAADAKKAQEDYAKGTDALILKLDQETRQIKTKIDLRRQEAAIVSELGKAYAALENAENDTMKGLAQKRIEQLRGQLGGVRGQAGKVQKSAAEYDRDRMERDDGVAAKRVQQDIASEQGPEEALRMAEERLRVIEERRRAAIELERLEAEAEARADAARAAGQEDNLREQQILAKMEKAKKDADGGEYDGKYLPEKERNALRQKQAELKSLQDELAAIQARKEGAGAEIGAQLDSGSELMMLRAKIAAYDEMMGAADAVTAAQNALTQATEETRKEAELDLEIAQRRAAATKAVAEQAGVSGWGANDREQSKILQDELEARRAQDKSVEAALRAEEEKKKLAYDVIRARLDGEAAVESLRMRGEERELRLLEIEREKLELKKQAGLIGEESYAREAAVMDERMAVLGREAKEKREMLAAEMVMSHLQRKLSEAQRTGDRGGAAGLRAEIAKREEAAERAAAERDARELGGEQNRQRYVAMRMNQFREQKKMEEDARRREEQTQQAAVRREANSGVNQLQARLMKLQGNHEGAKNLLKADQRAQDDAARQARARQLREEGFGAKEAESLAAKEMKTSQGERMLSKLFDQKGTVVAGSLAQIGGGGGVYGNDPQARALERAVKVLEQIRDNTKENVGDEWY
ncbi:hypothetical protein UFOVP736_26 [uncultured Caudovirales phage]|uniref:Tape measure domain-containing protein n=1 Tax=uncultured Caudovirales phage TaxID=2100421 RepID=A0A6J7X0V5_9CAUD|nr:hypothetical protein UFOVP705_55 [uncultured Caudovirales phage]CAB5224015.1 hypothetical protein UFOVP736_26 [uncultured Caudovirales phage]